MSAASKSLAKTSRSRIVFAPAAWLLATVSVAQDAHEHHHPMPTPTPAAEQAPVSTSAEPTQSEQEHVPPDPPTSQPDHAMPYKAMAKMMEMDDTSTTSKVLLDRLEWRHSGRADTLAWNAAAWWGNDYDKLKIEAEGERRGGTTESARTEALWDHVVARWWNLHTGVRQDSGPGPSRTWAALGVEGTAPGFVDIEATAYLGESGRAAARFSAARDVLFTQRLILQPELEANLFTQADPGNGLGSGLSSLEVGMRLRYEIRREFASYLGTVWSRRFGATARFGQASGEETNEWMLVSGFRVWF